MGDITAFAALKSFTKTLAMTLALEVIDAEGLFLEVGDS